MENQNRLYLTSNEDVLLDPNYRYQISKLMYGHQKIKGTMITFIENFQTFCKELQFDETILIKIIGKKLSVKIGFNKNMQLFYLQSQIDPVHVNAVVYDFIKKYLLCVLCDKPEVIIKNKIKGIKQKCKACGNKCYINGDDDINQMI
jgi:translation initiation factor 2 beta subunit (eIF-2beta)/eIF-5